MADATGFSVSQRPGIIAAVAFALGIAVATIVPAHSGREIDGAKASLRFPPPPGAPGAQLHQLQLQLMQMQLQLQNLTRASPPAPSCSPLPSESRAPSASTVASPSETRAPSASAAASPSPAAAVSPSQAAGITSAAASVRHCGRTWPIAGVWSRASGTWSYRPSNCEMAPLAAPGAGEPLAQCLAGRRVFALGNSVARQFAFELPTLIHNSSRMPIEEQKVTCAKDALDVERCVIETGYRTVVRPLWFLHLNGWPGGGLEFVRPDIYLSPKRGWDGDVCGKLPTEECLRSIFGESQASDVLLFNIGIAYAIWDPAGVDDVRMWRLEAARAFIRSVRATFKGKVVYMNVSPMQSNDVDLSFPQRYVQERAERYNEQVMQLFLAETDWSVFDVFSVNRPVLYAQPPLYADAYHFPGLLTQIGWHIILPMICPDTLPPRQLSGALPAQL